VLDLSICIPTFNRFEFLKWTLRKTQHDFTNPEIIISDNNSTDDTRTAIHWGHTYIKQETNIGAFENMRATLLAAKTKYCMYLGDDDYLLHEQTARAVAWLDDHPAVLAYVAPCELWNEVNACKVFDAFYVSENITFGAFGETKIGNRIREDFWNFIIARHVWPEHIIWRRNGLERILQPRLRAYWAFVDITNAFLLGPVHFARRPFYRSIVQHPVGNRDKLGDRQCLVCFDEYRAGLEVMAYDLFRGSLTPELKIQIQNMITKFITIRLEVAARLLRRQNINAEAESYEKRMMLGMLGRHD
jgi:glycosyltransferase involved in cell wall biosynthesis